MKTIKIINLVDNAIFVLSTIVIETYLTNLKNSRIDIWNDNTYNYLCIYFCIQDFIMDYVYTSMLT